MRTKIQKWLLMCLFMGIAFSIGLAVPDRYVSRGIAKIQRMLGGQSAEPGVTESHATSFTSIHFGLNAETIQIPRVESGYGGALTSLGRELLVLRRDGRVFVVKNGEVFLTSIDVPDNGLSDYMEAARTKYADLEHKFEFFRYNDILYIDKQTQKFLILSYTEYQADKECYSNAVAKLEVSVDVSSALEVTAIPGDWDVLFRSQPCLTLKTKGRAIEGHMAGGRIAFKPPNKIVLGSGDYHWDGVSADQAISRKDEFEYGKVIEIDIQNGGAKVLSKGHRNLQGVVVANDNTIWVTEHGARGGDELNKITVGADYGWPKTTLSTKYNTLPWPGEGRYGHHDGPYEPPILAWLPSVAPSGITEVRGFHDAWDGDLLISTYQGGGLERVRIIDGRAQFSERITIDERIRYVQQHFDGRIALWTDSSKVIFLSPADIGYGNDFISSQIASLGLTDRQASRLQVIVNNCLECHSLSGRGESRATSLADMFGEPIGQGASSSAALREVGGVWGLENLSDYIACPECTAPSTLMPNQNIDAIDARNTASLLRVLSEQFQ